MRSLWKLVPLSLQTSATLQPPVRVSQARQARLERRGRAPRAEAMGPRHTPPATLSPNTRPPLPVRRHAEELAELPSLVRFETEATDPGDRVKRTVDLDTCAGLAVLLHADAAQVEADYARLRALQPTLFEVESVETGDGVA